MEIQSLNKTLIVRGVVPDNYNIGNISSTGLISNSIYELTGAYTYVGLPTGVTWGVLEIICASSFIVERITTANKVYTRVYSNSAWGTWF